MTYKIDICIKTGNIFGPLECLQQYTMQRIPCLDHLNIATRKFTSGEPANSEHLLRTNPSLLTTATIHIVLKLFSLKLWHLTGICSQRTKYFFTLSDHANQARIEIELKCCNTSKTHILVLFSILSSHFNTHSFQVCTAHSSKADTRTNRHKLRTETSPKLSNDLR